MKYAKFRLLTLNIHKGFSFANKTFVLDKIKTNIQQTEADIVCLQEVVGQNDQKGMNSQYEFIAEKIWRHTAYGENAISRHGHHGNAILSLFPIIYHKNFDVSNSRLERRGILYGVLKINNSTYLHLMTLHFDLTSTGRDRQLKKLCQLIENKVPVDAPLVVCGDFNDWREKASSFLEERADLREANLIKYNRHSRTFPSISPIFKLDRIYVRNVDVEQLTQFNHRIWRGLSDHLPLEASLQIPI